MYSYDNHHSLNFLAVDLGVWTTHHHVLYKGAVDLVVYRKPWKHNRPLENPNANTEERRNTGATYAT
jgi:hypothetical protein